MKSYPIWHNVTACNYKSSKSWGSIDTSEESILVGSSKNNSHQLVSIVTTRRFYKCNKHGDVCVFRFSVDGKIIKSLIFEDNNGKAGKLLETVAEEY